MTLNISLQAFKRIILLPRIGQETYTVGFDSIGVMKIKRWTYQCQDISRKKCRNMNTSCQNGCKHVHARLSQRDLALKPMPPSPLMLPPNWKGIQCGQKIVGSMLYYTRAVDMMVLIALNSIDVEETKATEQTMAHCKQLLDYLSHNANAKIWFHASDMVLNIHSDASYLLEPKAWSHTCGHFFMGWTPKKVSPSIWMGCFM